MTDVMATGGKLMGEKIVVNFNRIQAMPLPVKMWASHSKSRPGITHLTMLLADGTYVCTCEGGQLANKCWHIDKARDEG